MNTGEVVALGIGTVAVAGLATAGVMYVRREKRQLPISPNDGVRRVSVPPPGAYPPGQTQPAPGAGQPSESVKNTLADVTAVAQTTAAIGAAALQLANTFKSFADSWDN